MLGFRLIVNILNGSLVHEYELNLTLRLSGINKFLIKSKLLLKKNNYTPDLFYTHNIIDLYINVNSFIQIRRTRNSELCIVSLSWLGLWFLRQVFVVAHEVVVSQAFVVAP